MHWIYDGAIDIVNQTDRRKTNDKIWRMKTKHLSLYLLYDLINQEYKFKTEFSCFDVKYLQLEPVL